MIKQAKKIVRSLLPDGAIDLLKNNVHLLEVRRTEETFRRSGDTPAWLGADDLERLQNEYSYPPEYGYDPQSVEERGRYRAGQILKLQGGGESRRFLEIGCWDGMVSAALARKGKDVTAIDRRSAGFDPRAAAEGVVLRQMDAEGMEFADEEFDFIFSYDSFEHFEHPDRVFSESLRLLKKGGYLYLEFGPLYLSAFGEHAYRSITVPYCQVLFTEEMIEQFIRRHDLDPVDFRHVNRWRLDEYRSLWEGREEIEPILYHERRNLQHLDLIRTYPTCFRATSSNFTDFTVAVLQVQLQKV